MGYLNTKRTDSLKNERVEARLEAEGHQNFMAGTSFDLNDPILRLRVMAASSFFGEPQYYRVDETDKRKRRPVAMRRGESALPDRHVKHLAETLNGVDMREWRALSPAKAMEKAIDAALDHDVEATLRLAVDLRREDNIRTTPQVIVVRAANHQKAKGLQPRSAEARAQRAAWETPPNLVRKYARLVMLRGDEPAVQMSYQLAAYGRARIPNALKKAWADFLKTRDEYQVAKYRLEGRKVKTIDVVNLSHAHSAVIDRLVKGELKLGGERETWESIRSAGGSWEDAVKVMGHMALLRNVRNLVEAGVSQDLWRERLVETAPEGRQLPFRYFSAYREVEAKTTDGRVLDAIERAMRASVGNLPALPGRSLVLTDNSGSAHGTTTSSMGTMKVSTIGNLMGILTAMASEDGGDMGLFGDQIEWMAVRKGSSIIDQLKTAEDLAEKRLTGGTEHGIWLAFDQVTQKKERYDNIFVYSDMQAGHGGLYGTGRGYADFVWGGGRSMYGSEKHIDVPKLVQRYRKTVNPRVNVFLVQTAGYEDTLMPEWYDRTFILGGWSDGILKFARRMIDLADGRSGHADRNQAA